jgi:hypothetical protein
MGQVKDAAVMEWATIVDPHHGGTPVVEVDDPNPRPEGQGAVGRCHGAAGERFTARGAIAVKAGAVPTGLSIGDATG